MFGKLLDLNRLVIPGGLERTELAYQELFAAAGFRLSRIVRTSTEVSILGGANPSLKGRIICVRRAMGAYRIHGRLGMAVRSESPCGWEVFFGGRCFD